MHLCIHLSQAPEALPPLQVPRWSQAGNRGHFIHLYLSCSVQASGQATPEPGRVQPLRASDAPALGLSQLSSPPAEGHRVMSWYFSLPGHLVLGTPGLEAGGVGYT